MLHGQQSTPLPFFGMKGKLLLEWHKRAFVFLWCTLIASVFLAYATKSSPLFPFNDWVDANILFTVGKGMANGKVLYRDLFDHKGPLIYAINGLAWVISPQNFWGVYILESLFFSVFLYYSYRIISLLSDDRYAILGLPILAAIILNSRGFTHGASAEEFCIPFITFSLYHLLKYLLRYPKNPINNKTMVANGFAAGCVFFIKYSMMGFWAGWLIILIFPFIFQANLRLIIKSLTLFVFGFLIAAAPWFVYFSSNNSFSYFFEAYFFLNLNSYNATLPLFQRLGLITSIMWSNVLNNPAVALLVTTGVIGSMTMAGVFKTWHARLAPATLTAALAAGVYGGGQIHKHYFLAFAPMAIVGMGILAHAAKYRMGFAPRNIKTLIISTALFALALSHTVINNQNAAMRMVKTDDLAQFKFAKIINQSSDKTILNYGWLDMGLYMATNTVPNIRFFFKSNISSKSFPEADEEQSRYIRDGITEFIVFSVADYLDRKDIAKTGPDHTDASKKYTLIATEIQDFEEVTIKYLLYQRNRVGVPSSL